MSHVAEALHTRLRVLRLYSQLLQRLSQREHHTITGRFSPAQRSAHAYGFAGDKSREPSAMDFLELVQHPQHVLRIRHHIGSWHIGDGTHVLCNLANPSATDLFLLMSAQIVRIAYHSAFGAPQWD